MSRWWWRGARSAPATSVLLALVVLVSAALATAGPVLLRDLGERSQRDAALDTPALTRALRADVVVTFSGSPPVWDAVDAAMTGFADTWQPALTDLAGPGEALLTMDPLRVDGPTPAPEGLSGRLLQLRTIRTLADHVQIVEGEAPAASPDLGEPLEIAVAVDVANEIGLQVGDLVRPGGLIDVTGEQVQLLVTGVFAADDGSTDYFDQQIGALEPSYLDDPNSGVFATGGAYLDPGSVDRLIQLQAGLTLQTWYPLGTEVGDGRAVTDALRDAAARAVPVDTGFATVDLVYGSALLDRLETVAAQLRATTAMLATIASGPVGVMVALVLAVARLAALRRGPTLALARARGASQGRLRGLLAVEGALLGMGAAALGAGLAVAVTPGPVRWTDLALPAVLALAPAAGLALAPLPSLRATRSEAATPAARRTRLLLELGAVALAGTAVYLLLAGGAADAGSVDLVAAAAPLLLALAGAVLATRLLGPPLVLVQTSTRRRRGVAAFLGSARAARERRGGLLPLMSLLTGVAIAVFSTTLVTTIDDGLRDNAAGSVGADLAVSGSYYDADQVAAAADLDGVAAVSSALELAGTAFSVDDRFLRISVYAVDTTTLADAQRDVPGALALPDGMDRPADGVLPMVLSAGYGDVEGDRLSINVEGQHPVTLVGRAPAAPGLVAYPDDPWAVVDATALRELVGLPLPARQVLVRLEPDADVAATTQQVFATLGERGAVTSMSEIVDDVAGTPLAAALPQGSAIALAVSAAQSVLAIALAVVAGAPSRRRLLSVLRTLGASSRESRVLLAWEIAPTALVGIGGGTLLGLVLPHLVVAALDLSSVTGGIAPTVSYDPARLGLVVAAAAVVVALLTTLAGALARRAWTSELRIGEAA